MFNIFISLWILLGVFYVGGMDFEDKKIKHCGRFLLEALQFGF